VSGGGAGTGPAAGVGAAQGAALAPLRALLDGVADANVAVLAGGVSLEREVSLRSGARITDALVARGIEATLIDVGADLLTRLAGGGHDVAVVALHGASGEDGTVAALLELAGVPFSGSGSLVSRIAWDKPIAKGLFARAGLAVAPDVTLSQRACQELGAGAMVGRIAERLGFPLVVKPANGGSSLGVSRVESVDELAPAILTALSYADTALIARWIIGTEVAVTVLDGSPLPAVEIVPIAGAYDYAARYTAGATTFHVPARLDDVVLEACARTATIAADAVGARHLCRVDLIVDADGTPWVLEIDTSPGMTDTSLAPMAAAAAGLPFDELCLALVAMARRDGPRVAGSGAGSAGSPGSASGPGPDAGGAGGRR
jgi:D-alanine-D-alanine ligase